MLPRSLPRSGRPAAGLAPPPRLAARLSWALLAVLALPLLAACGSRASMTAAMAPQSEMAPAGAPMAPPAPPPPPPESASKDMDGVADERLAQNTPKSAPSRPDAGGQVLERRTPILIYTADLTMAVYEVDASLRQVEAMSLALGGFVSKRTDKMIIVRVPAGRFQEALSRIEKVGDVTRRDVAAVDVTEEYLDVEIRLRNARAVRDRLEILMGQAKTVQDSLLIEKELARVSSEIERMEGKLKFLRDRAAFSTLTVSFEARASGDPTTPAVRLPFPFLYTLGLGRLLDL